MSLHWLANRPCPRCGESVEFEVFVDYGSYDQPPDSGVEPAHDLCCDLTDAEIDKISDDILAAGYNGWDGLDA